MGNFGILKTLTDIAKYCDCLETTEQFQHQKQQTEKSQKSESENKQQLTVKQLPQPRRQIKIQVEELQIKQPPPAKIYKPLPPQPSLKRRSDLQIKQIIKLPKSLEEISELSQSPQIRKKDEMQIVDFAKDQDIQASNITSFSNPLSHSHSNLNRRRQARMALKRQQDQIEIQNIEISQIDEPPVQQQDYQAQFFIDSDEQSEYGKKERKVGNRSSYK